MQREYGQWPENVWISEEVSWKNAECIVAGIDLGTTSTQAVILCDGNILGYSNIYTGADFSQSAERAIMEICSRAGMAKEHIRKAAGTGFGKKRIPGAARLIDEVQCHAKGARYMFGPGVRTVVDMGGQTVKAIRLFDWDRVRDCMMNDKCAGGEGRNLETLCELLHVKITEIGPKSLETEKDPEPVSTTCSLFANTETLGLFGRPEFKCKKLTESEIYASHLFAVAWRILGVIGKLSPLDVGEIKIDGELAFTGGIAKNLGITARIERELGISAAKSDYDPMIAGALGAALLAE